MKKISLGILLLIVAVLSASLAAPVFADSITLNLYAPNAGVAAYPAPYASVTVSASNSAATITVVGLTTGGFTYELSSVGISTTQPVTLSNFSQSGFSDGGFGQQDGFGQFYVASGQPGSSSAVPNVSFTVTGANPFADAESVLTPDADGISAVAHIYVFDSTGAPLATGFAGNGTSSDVVPEPATLFLFGSGLIGLAALRRRIFQQ